MSDSNYEDKFLTVLTSGGFNKVCYREWGDVNNKRVLICVHGLSRNRLDFDAIAQSLSSVYKVLAVDMPGRGNSDWLIDPEDYRYLDFGEEKYPVFHNVVTGLIARSGADVVDWIGTSMGGLLGIEMASRKKSPVRRLVLNDIGPFVSAEGRADNAALAVKAGVYDTKELAIQFVLESKKAFGPFTPAAAKKFAEDSLVLGKDNKWRLHYDPKAVASREIKVTDLWARWDHITASVLTVWGKQSTLLSEETVRKMQNSGPGTKVLAIEGVGHCPGLTTELEINTIKEFLLT